MNEDGEHVAGVLNLHSNWVRLVAEVLLAAWIVKHDSEILIDVWLCNYSYHSISAEFRQSDGRRTESRR